MQIATNSRPVQQAGSPLIAEKSSPSALLRTSDDQANIVSRVATSHEWVDHVRLRAERRWYERLYHGPDYDIWVISWLPGQSTGFHDHGASSGAFVVATGILEELCVGECTKVIHPGKPRTFGPDYAHDVRNVSLAPAISIHAYSPPLNEMNEYALEGSRLVPRERASTRADALDQDWQVQKRKPVHGTGASTIEDLLSAARARLRRLSPNESYEAIAKTGAMFVDIRPEGQRAIEGNIAGALVVDRNVLEWRFDPTSSARLPIAKDHDLEVIVFCSEGYASSLAAAALQDLGFWRATDMVGGFLAWRAKGLPFVPPNKAS